jgi:hypothetical protein
LPSLGLEYTDLVELDPGLIMCSLTPFGQTGPWRDYATSDLLHLAAGGQMASCGYDEVDVPGASPMAPGGGNAWHMGCDYAYMAIMAALVYRTVTPDGTPPRPCPYPTHPVSQPRRQVCHRSGRGPAHPQVCPRPGRDAGQLRHGRGP